MKKLEYTIKLFKIKNETDYLNELNKLGADGWMLFKDSHTMIPTGIKDQEGRDIPAIQTEVLMYREVG